ncbi:MAG: hypothetical protein AAF518_26790 [Spirochaetota bacterium]
MIRQPIPGKILDAKFVEEKLGDGFLGPSDYRFFAHIQIVTSEVELWEKSLGNSLADTNYYNYPKEKQDWWFSKLDFQQVQKYPPNLFNCIHGWVVVRNATVYVYTYTQ